MSDTAPDRTRLTAIVTSTTPGIGEAFNLLGRLSNIDDPAFDMSGLTISVLVAKKKLLTFDFSNPFASYAVETTNASGDYTMPVRILESGVYRIRVIFAGAEAEGAVREPIFG